MFITPLSSNIDKIVEAEVALELWLCLSDKDLCENQYLFKATWKSTSGNINRDQDQRTEANDFYVLFFRILFGWVWCEDGETTNNENLCFVKKGGSDSPFLNRFLSWRETKCGRKTSGKHFVMICFNSTKLFLRILKIIGRKRFGNFYLPSSGNRYWLRCRSMLNKCESSCTIKFQGKSHLWPADGKRHKK